MTMSCDHCEKVLPIMMAMCDGRMLCSRCWLDGAFPGKLGNVKVYNEDTDRATAGALAGRSLVTGTEYRYTGETMNLRTGERSAAKAETASFDKHPNGPPAKQRKRA